MNNLLVIAPLLGFVGLFGGFLAFQQYQFNQMLKVNAQIKLRKRINTATYTVEEKIAARDWA